MDILTSKHKATAVILASGKGQRFSPEIPKQFLKLAGKAVLEHTLDVFERHAQIDEIIVVVSNGHRQLVEDAIVRGLYRKVTHIVNGGGTRQASSAAGVSAIENENTKVLVHDAVRPLLNSATIDRCLEALDSFDAVDTGVPSPDTVIRLAADGCIGEIPDREQMRLGQTPQAFRAGILRKAHTLAASDVNLRVTDDCALILHYNLSKVHVVSGDISNIKITYPSDIYLADRLFQVRSSTAVQENSLAALSGKVIVIFGASKGIGKYISELSTTNGAHVRAVSRSDGINVANTQDVKSVLGSMVERYGRIDFIANTAGVLRTGLLAGQDDATIDEQILTNLRGSAIVAREGFKIMHKLGGSIALFTSSSYTRGRSHSAIYSATKAAVVNLMQGLTEEYLPFNVRINAINPERTATPMRTENFGFEPKESLLDAETVAKATLVALLSERTGQVIDVRR